jgi:hypothetical protein
VQAAFVSALGVAIASGFSGFKAQPAQAQAAYGSYVGIGGAYGITSEAETGENGGFSGVIAGRYRFLKMPISIRAQAFIFGGSFAFVPTISYDYPLNWNTDIYLGAGISLASGDDPSPVGNQNAFVLQPGIDYIFPNSRLALFGNAVIAFNGFREGGNTAVSLQGGVGYQF